MRVSFKVVFAAGYFLTLFSSGCGVKGDPVAPTKPLEFGSGKPKYNRIDKRVKPGQQEDEANKKNSIKK